MKKERHIGELMLDLKRTLTNARTKKSWPSVSLGVAIRYRKEFVTIDDVKTYKRCRVQLHAKGIVLRDIVTGAEIRTKEQQVCRVGEFLVAEIDAKVGGIGIVPKNLDGAIVSSHYFLFVIDQTVLDKYFLEFYLRTPAFLDQVAARGSTNYAAIRPHHVLEYKIPLPPIDEQRRIIGHLERADMLKRMQAEATAEIDAFSRSVLHKAFNGEL